MDLAVKEHLLDLQKLSPSVLNLLRWVELCSVQSIIFLRVGRILRCASCLAGGVSSLIQSHEKPEGLRGSSC